MHEHIWMYRNFTYDYIFILFVGGLNFSLDQGSFIWELIAPQIKAQNNEASHVSRCKYKMGAQLNVHKKKLQ